MEGLQDVPNSNDAWGEMGLATVVCSKSTWNRREDDALTINGKVWRSARPVLCVFDTGLTGVVISKSLVDEMQLASSDGRAYTESDATAQDAAPAVAVVSSATTTNVLPAVRSLSLSLRTERGERVILGSDTRASPLFYAQSVSINWFVGETGTTPHVVAVGQCILSNGVLTVDGPQMRATWTSS